MENEKISTVLVILNCLCAIVWDIKVIIDLAYGFPNMLHVIFAILWDFLAIMWVVKYVKSKKTINK